MRSYLPPKEVRERRCADSRPPLCSTKLFSQEKKRKLEVRLTPTAPSRSCVLEPINLPPPFTLVRLREGRDAFAHAVEIAEESGAGTLTYVGRFDLAEFAVVLEPGEPLRTARRAFYAGMVALTDALRAYAPPIKEIVIDWPDAIRVDGSLVGGGRLGWSSSAKEDEPPRWLVFGAMIRTVAMTDKEAGVYPLASALDQEGFGEAGAVQLTESFARHLMRVLDAWQTDGFDGIAREYVTRLVREPNTSRMIADDGDLLVCRIGIGSTDRRDLRKSLLLPSWLDPKLGGPRL
ncbi:MAG: biotin/lipoate--protein ligase family protein [Bradyrhizobium sp.]|nr:biotin/lipoate--protein ligase family protein [Bradyrhizobium sp.]